MTDVLWVWGVAMVWVGCLYAMEGAWALYRRWRTGR